MMMGKKPKFLMLLKQKKSMMDEMDSYHDDMDYGAEEEDEAGGFEREGMRIAAADLIQAIRSDNEIKAMDALETFINLCKKG